MKLLVSSIAGKISIFINPFDRIGNVFSEGILLESGFLYLNTDFDREFFCLHKLFLSFQFLIRNNLRFAHLGSLNEIKLLSCVLLLELNSLKITREKAIISGILILIHGICYMFNIFFYKYRHDLIKIFCFRQIFLKCHPHSQIFRPNRSNINY